MADEKRHGTMRRTARKIAREEATQQILRWRTEENMSLEECAQRIGCARSTAHEYEKRALAELAAVTTADAEHRRAVMTEQLREVRRAHWNSRDEAKSAEVVLKTFEQERKLWGLDAPAKSETKTTVGFDDLSDEELERRWQEARKRDAGEA
jgi:transcriptional regulator with XRE-family HTH domain